MARSYAASASGARSRPSSRAARRLWPMLQSGKRSHRVCALRRAPARSPASACAPALLTRNQRLPASSAMASSNSRWPAHSASATPAACPGSGGCRHWPDPIGPCPRPVVRRRASRPRGSPAPPVCSAPARRATGVRRARAARRFRCAARPDRPDRIRRRPGRGPRSWRAGMPAGRTGSSGRGRGAVGTWRGIGVTGDSTISAITPPRRPGHFGMSTVSMTWITPLDW